MRERRHRLAAAILVVVAVGSLCGSATGSSNDLHLSSSSVTLGGSLSILGPGLAGLRDAYDVTVGPQLITNKSLGQWSSAGIGFSVRTEPGTYEVALLPRVPGATK